MKKTLTANISGLVFNIDEDAYEKLNLYLGNVRRHFTSDEGCDEILSDIESRIAEMLQDKTTLNKQVITLEDINEVIGQLGDPSQIRGEETAEEPIGGATYYEKTQKRLYRDPDNKYLGGVAGGLGAYFSIDPTWLRVAFVVFTFVYGFGPLVYIILWIVVPKATTTAEKLEMRGRRVTISNIEKSIREELNDLKKNIQDFSNETKENLKKKENRDSVENALESVGLAFASAFSVLFRVIGGLIGAAFIFLGIFLLIAVISSLFYGHVPVSFPFGPVQIFSIHSIIEVFFTSPLVLNLAVIGFLLVFGIPLIALIYSGLRLIFGFESRIRYFGMISFMLWIAGVALVVFAGLHTASNFAAEETVREEKIFQTTEWPNIYLDIDPDLIIETPDNDNFDYGRHGDWLWISQTQQGSGIPRLRILTTQDETMSLTIIRESRGSSYMEAREIARSITYNFTQQDSLITFDPVFYFDIDDGWRAQKVYLELHVPENKVVILSPELKEAIDARWSNSPRVIGEVYQPREYKTFSLKKQKTENYNAFPGKVISFFP